MNNRECFYIIKRYQEILKLRYTPTPESNIKLEQTLEKLQSIEKSKKQK